MLNEKIQEINENVQILVKEQYNEFLKEVTGKDVKDFENTTDYFKECHKYFSERWLWVSIDEEVIDWVLIREVHLTKNIKRYTYEIKLDYNIDQKEKQEEEVEYNEEWIVINKGKIYN